MTPPPFPWRRRSHTHLRAEFQRLVAFAKKPQKQSRFKLTVNRVGYDCSNHFFQHQRLRTRQVRQSTTTFAYWRKNHAKVAELFASGAGYKGDMFRHLCFLSHPPCPFPVTLAMQMYLFFGAKSVFDPYAGWGDRCVAAMACGLRYVGVDCNPQLAKCFRKMIAFFGKEGETTFLLSRCEDVDVQGLDFDLLFSSPPFFADHGLTELYPGTSTDQETFFQSSLVPVVERAFSKKAMVCLHLPQTMAEKLRAHLKRPWTMEFPFRTTTQHQESLFYWAPTTDEREAT